MIHDIRGNVNAIGVGGNTDAPFLHPDHPDHEGIDQLVARNVLRDIEGVAFEIRGALRARIVNNVVETRSDFAVFRLQCGHQEPDEPAQNDQVVACRNDITSIGVVPQYARNDCGPGTFRFGAQTWRGNFRQGDGPDIPVFPRPSDTVID